MAHEALTPFYTDGIVTIYHGDALAVLPALDASSSTS
jgi:hypothetical protein